MSSGVLAAKYPSSIGFCFLAWAVLVLTGCGAAEKGADRSKVPDSGTSDSDGSAAGTGGNEKDGGAQDSGMSALLTCAAAGCDKHASCADVAGDAKCSCAVGYVGNGKSCVDVDECAGAALNDCDQHATCKNSDGGYSCACNEGFSGDGKKCKDVDECKAGTQACGVDETCKNTSGAATCQCAAGYALDGGECKDVDECSGATPKACGANATCKNTPGSAFCKCVDGYHDTDADPEAVTCVQNTACTNGGNECGVNETTRSSCMSNVCVCDPGYATTDGVNCTDINECTADESLDPCISSATCTNAAGTYSCGCKPGFTGDGQTCTDIDECKAKTDDCDALATCTNTAGSYTCTCPSGYSGDGTTCTNINECSLGTADCNVNADCTDKSPGFSCKCRSGFTGDGKANCTDIDECSNMSLNTCMATETCTNFPGSYTCGCDSPYVKKGNACYCDLTGIWGMRQDVTSSWPAVTLGITTFVNAGTLHSTVWELHRMVYDGTTIKVQKKGCGPNKTPDLRAGSVWSNETYGTYIPTSVWNGFGLFQGGDVSISNAKPGSTFTSPKEAAVLGIKLTNPLTDAWPSLANAVHDDAEGDGIDGLMIWTRAPGTTTQAGSPKVYSYPRVGSDRVVCVTTATRAISHLEGMVTACDRITGTVKRDLVPGQKSGDAPRVDQHTYDCRIPVNADTPYGCTKADWNDTTKMKACSTGANSDVSILDGQVDQTTVNATFELKKLDSDPDADIDCDDVRTMLPAYP